MAEGGDYYESLHCLSAFGLFGTRGHYARIRLPREVFIAFRLLVCLGRHSTNGSTACSSKSSLPFGFWSVWDRPRVRWMMSNAS